jgi:hypothetical protein
MSDSFTSYNGYIKDIPSDASPGLRFLSLWMQTIDSLDQNLAPISLTKLLSPTAKFIMNGGEPIPGDRIPQMFEQREKMLSAFSHQAQPISAFDLVHESGTRTVICECVSS